MKKKRDILRLSIKKELVIIASLLLLIPILIFGIVSFIYAESELDEKGEMILNTICVFFIVIMIGLIIIALVSKKITRPIMELAGCVNEIEKGNYELSISDKVLNRKDELGLLARAINNMKRQLKENFQKIYNQNKTLEKEIKERKRSQENVDYLIKYDMLTGLPQKSLFMENLQALIKKAELEDKLIGLMTLGLDDFKFINEAMGYPSGDELLLQVSNRLKEEINDVQDLARITGDEFGIILYNITDIDEVVVIANKLLDIFSRPFMVQGKEIFITSSIGISIYPLDGSYAETLIKNATAAQNHVKKTGKNNYEIYSRKMNENAYEILEMISYLRHALEEEQFILHYQPQVSSDKGNINGMEALIRWNHPKLGLVYPDKFISLTEKTGMILYLSEWVIREACRQNKIWHDEGYKNLVVSINLSAAQFKKKNLSDTIKDILKKTKLPPEYLEIEITEGMLMEDVQQAVEIMLELKEIGVKVAIDDFGTGYSSLNYLRNFPIDRLKIDRSFIMGIPHEDDGAIAKIIIDLANSLNLKVVAEGVETEEQLNFLKIRKCDSIQGYYFSKPLPLDKIEALLSENKRLD